MSALDRVTTRALRLKPGEVLLTLLMVPFRLLGWFTYWVAWTPLAFLIASVIDGWQQANQQSRRLQAAAAERENR